MYKQANLSFSVAAQSFGDDVTSIQFSTQDKNSAKLIFTIKEGKQPLDLTDVEGLVDLVMGDKSVFDDNKATVTAPLDGKLEYTLTPEQIRHSGRAKGELQLVSKDGQAIGGFRFNFTIKPALVDEYSGPVKEFYIQDLEAVKQEVKKKADAVVLDIDEFKVEIDSRTAVIEEQLDSLDDNVGQSTVLQVDSAKKDTTGQTHSDLDSRIKAEVGKINTKQGELTAALAEMPKTVNNISPDDDGNIQIPVPDVDTTNLATKQELAEKIDKVVSNGNMMEFYSKNTLIRSVDITQAGNQIYVQSYIDTLVKNGQIAGVTLATRSLTSEKYGRSSVDFEAIKGVKVGKNLFNKQDYIAGQYIDGAGNLQTGTSGSGLNSLSGFIPVEPSTIYYTNKQVIVVYYTEERAKISNSTMVGSTTITTPANARYVRLSFRSVDLDSLQFEKGNTGTTYENWGFVVAGLKQDESIVENFSVVNELLNPDFLDGNANWSGITVVDGIASHKSTSVGGGFSQYNRVIAGKIYYLKASILSTSKRVALMLGSTKVFHSGSGAFETLSLVHAATGAHGQFTRDERSTGWDDVKVDKFVLINMTDTFGAGKEPTKEQMDYLLNSVWFTSKYDIFDKRKVLTTALEGAKPNIDTALDQMKIDALYSLSYIRPMIETVASKVNALQTDDTYTFGLITDTHLKPNLIRFCRTIAEASKYMPMDFIAHGGDLIDGMESKATELKMLVQAMNEFNHAKVPFLMAMGNHDDNNWYSRVHAATKFRAENYISNLEIYNRTVRFAERDIVLGSRTGMYYYRDNEASKIRFIVLNNYDYPWIENNGVKVYDANHNEMYSNEQLNWLAKNALDFEGKSDPSEWGVIVLSHELGKTSTQNYEPLHAILNAYKGGTTYSGSGNASLTDNNTNTTTAYPWSVNVDYTSQGTGDVICLLAGDDHEDAIDTISGFKRIRTLNASLAKDKGTAPVKTYGTETETAWDVFTINRETRTINITRFGAGADRVTTY